MAAPDFYSVAPDCIQHGLPPGLPYSAEIAKPFENCTGFFTFGPGKQYSGAAGQKAGDFVGQIVGSPTAGLLTLTAIGFAVSMLAFVAWVWFEHRRLMDRAEKLRAAGVPHVGRTRTE